MENNQTTVVITGMHRSGTSLTTSLLQSAGVFIGDRLLGTNLSNPKGHFEDLDFVEFHQSLLQSQGLRSEGWIDNAGKHIPAAYTSTAQNLIARRSHHLNWGWKDPRTTLFLDFWSELIPDAKYIFVYRSPWEVVDSLFRRGDSIFQSDPDTAIKTWVNYNQKILNFCNSTSRPWILLRIEDVIDRPQFAIDSINQKLDLSLISPHALYDADFFQASKVNLYKARLVQKYSPDAIKLYARLHRAATLPNDIGKAIAVEEATKLAWFWQNWLDRPVTRLKTIRYWYKLKRSVV
ncbi:MAG: sulfotransferase [Cyanobacteria bacterium P01_G01_bin.19]